MTDSWFNAAEEVEEAAAPLEVVPDEHFSDLGNARRLVRRHGDELRYCRAWRKWLIWDGARWKRDERGEAEQRGKLTVVSIYNEIAQCRDADERKALTSHALKSEGEPRIRAMLSLAETEPKIAVHPDDLDRDPFLLSCPNATIDLRTGNPRENRPDDLITRGSEVHFDPEAECPRWQQFLGEVFGGDADLIAFMQRLIGYSLTGDTREHVLPVLHGAGFNGKTTLIEAVTPLLGDLAAVADVESFVRQPGDRGIRNDLARLNRARLVTASESQKGRRLDEATIKKLTGGDTIVARFLHAEHFEFKPEFKLWLITNFRPRVDGGDEAIWRRLRLIPFEVSFEGRKDPTLPEKLRAEASGILNWAIAGCMTWQREGLGQASAVTDATAAYRADEDVLGAFLEECCVLEADAKVEKAKLREAYEHFCAEQGEDALAPSVLGKELAARGISRGGTGGASYKGVDLR